LDEDKKNGNHERCREYRQRIVCSLVAGHARRAYFRAEDVRAGCEDRGAR
jgi:hypothetical protein